VRKLLDIGVRMALDTLKAAVDGLGQRGFVDVKGHAGTAALDGEIRLGMALQASLVVSGEQ
jgi:hypothetical protein